MPRATFVLPLILAAGFAQPCSAGADFPQIERHAAVSLAGLNPADPGDAGVILARVETAAKHACGIMPERDPAYASAPHFVVADFKACVAAAMARTVAVIKNPALAKRYAETYGLANPAPASR
jgi:hypothetical protein